MIRRCFKLGVKSFEKYSFQPTQFRFYSKKKSNKKDEKEEDDEETVQVEINFKKRIGTSNGKIC